MKSITKELCDKYFNTGVEVDMTSKQGSDLFIARIKYFDKDFEGGENLHYVRIFKTVALTEFDVEPEVKIPKTSLSWQIFDDEYDIEDL